MGRVGRPPSIDAPPCPECETTDDVVSHRVQEVEGQLRRAFRCTGCSRVFVPGFEDSGPSDELKAAVRRVRRETEAPYRLIARALSRHLGVDVSHTTVGAWCRDRAVGDDGDDGALVACEYLSVLWALRYEIRDEADSRGSA